MEIEKSPKKASGPKPNQWAVKGYLYTQTLNQPALNNSSKTKKEERGCSNLKTSKEICQSKWYLLRSSIS